MPVGGRPAQTSRLNDDAVTGIPIDARLTRHHESVVVGMAGWNAAGLSESPWLSQTWVIRRCLRKPAFAAAFWT